MTIQKIYLKSRHWTIASVVVLAAMGFSYWLFLGEEADEKWGKVVRRSPEHSQQYSRPNAAKPKPVRLELASLPWRAVSGPLAFSTTVDLPQGDLPWTAADLTGGFLASADTPAPLFTETASLPSWSKAAGSIGTTEWAKKEVDTLASAADELAERQESDRLMRLREVRAKPTPKAQQLATRLSLPDLPRFVTSLASGPGGTIWIGSEDAGVVRYNPATHTVRRFTTRDGLGDNNGYALAVDRLGRVWAGHLNHGVSVYNGDPSGRWQCYEVLGGLSRPDTLNGPIGERVFAIKVCPTDGDVWISTNCGLARYSESSQTWSYYTQADGLPSNEINSIAFDPAGNVYLATQCEGIAMADAADEYRHWRTMRGADELPTTPTGDGLPTSLINDVLVAQDGTVYAATCLGLARSTDRGATWQYTRGLDWADKVRMSHAGPPSGWQELPGATLTEDYCTTLAEDTTRGMLWIGHRDHSIEVIDLQDPKNPTRVGDFRYVTAIIPPPPGPQGRATIGSYGVWAGDIVHAPAIGRAVAWQPENSRATASNSYPPYPAAAQPRTQQNLQTPSERQPTTIDSTHQNPTLHESSVVLLPDDWRTQGSWLGRYGRYWACLSAMDVNDYLWGATPQPLAYHAQVGYCLQKLDLIRYWRHWLYTDNPKSLEIPCAFMDNRVKFGLTTWATDRRQADWDDHGEAYPGKAQGPDIYCTVDVPVGVFQLSLYEFNKDAHDLDSPYRSRDHTVLIYTRPPGSSLDFVASQGDRKIEPVARTRVRQYWGGVYKRFLVQGPTVLTVKVDRKYSGNAILTAVLLDTLAQRPLPFDAGQISDQATINKNFNLAKAAENFYSYAQSQRQAKANYVLPSVGNAEAVMSDRFWLWQYEAWERSQRAVGIQPIRDIERALRWDGVRKKSRGLGYEMLTEHLNRNSR